MVIGTVEESGGINPHIPEKVYRVRLAGVREKILPDMEKRDKKGNVVLDEHNKPVLENVNRWEWVFGLRQEEGKPDSDIRFTALTSPFIRTKSNAYSFVKALIGEAPQKGKEFDTDILIGKYADATVKDKDPRKDRFGNIQQVSGIKELSPANEPTPEIDIEGLMEEEEPEDDAPTPEEKATPPPPPTPPAEIKKKKK